MEQDWGGNAMEQRGMGGFISAQRRYMRLTARLRNARRHREPEETDVMTELLQAGEQLVKTIKDAQGRGLDFREFYAEACESVGENDVFLLLDWEEDNDLLLGVRMAQLEFAILETEKEQEAKKTGMEVFFGALASQDAFSREISENYKRHAHMLWQLVKKGKSFKDIVSLRNQGMNLSREEIERLRR